VPPLHTSNGLYSSTLSYSLMLPRTDLPGKCAAERDSCHRGLYIRGQRSGQVTLRVVVVILPRSSVTPEMTNRL